MKNYKLWLLQACIPIIISLMVLSFIGPWWTVYVQSEPGELAVVNLVVNLYQWGIPGGQQEEFFAADVTPFYQVVLARIFLAASVIVILSSYWLKGNRSKLLLGSVGTIWIVYAAIALVVISTRTEEYDINLQGISHIYRDSFPIVAISKLQIGYYLSYAAGLLCIALMFIRSKTN